MRVTSVIPCVEAIAARNPSIPPILRPRASLAATSSPHASAASRVTSGTRPHHVGNIHIEQRPHKSISRGLSFRRSISSPEPLSGELLKNSASDSLGFVFLAHSSADTTTAVSRPCFVIRCGPSFSARSSTSLNFAFASATVHRAFVIPVTSLRLSRHLCFTLPRTALNEPFLFNHLRTLCTLFCTERQVICF